MKIKEYDPEIAVCVLTASDDSQDLVKSFGSGADDFIQKPFLNEELLVRIKTRLSDQKKSKVSIIIDDITLNKKSIEVFVKDKLIDLTQTEFKLLEYLMDNMNIVLTREQILTNNYL